MQNDLKTVIDFYQKAADKMWLVECNGHGGTIAVEAVMNDMPANKMHADGALVIPITDENTLLSYRKRTDGSMGYSCSCGNSSIKLPEEQSAGNVDISLPHIKAQIAKALENSDHKDTAFTRKKA